MFVVLCNCPPGEAHTLARTLVLERLVACINVIPAVTSYFVWNHRLEESEESTLIIKVPAPNLDRLRERIHALHSYDIVEILVLPVDADRSDADYVEWVRSFGLSG